MRVRLGLAAAILAAAIGAAPAFGDPPLTDVIARATEDPHNPNLAYDLALAYHAEHRLPDAIRAYRHALQLDPTNTLVHTSLQTALTELGLLEDARATFSAAMTGDDDDPGLEFNLGAAAEQAGLIEEAVFHYERYLALAPNAPDVGVVAKRIDLLAKAIHHRQVRIVQLTTRPRRVHPGERATVLMTYELRGWGRYNRTGVVEAVQLFHDDRETHRFVQRSIRRDNRRYQTAIEILIPPDAAPGTYLLTAQAEAGSRRDEQVTPFAIDPPAIAIPEPIPPQAMASSATTDATQEREAGQDFQVFTVTNFGPPLVVEQPSPVEVESPGPDHIGPSSAKTQPSHGAPRQDGWLIEEDLPPPSAPSSAAVEGAPLPIPAPDAPPAPASGKGVAGAARPDGGKAVSQPQGEERPSDAQPAREPYPPDPAAASPTPPAD